MMFESNTWNLWLAGGSGLALTYAITPLVRRLALRVGCVDRPSGDRWGRRVVARLGGIALVIGFVGSTALWVKLDRALLGLLGGCGVVFTVGVFDDFRRLRPYTKLLWQLAVGCFLVMWGIRIEIIQWPWLSIPLSIFWFLLLMNAFNLLDNMDGLAVGVGAVAAAFCTFHAAFTGQWTIATMSAIVTGACVGFLRYNFPPAKIFMGDSGSHFLGLSLAALALLGSWRHSTQLLSVLAIPAFVLALPIFDTCFVTIQRLAHQRHPFQGGVDHVSHRLAILGLSQRQTAVALYGFSIGFGLLSLVSLYLRPLSAIVMWLLALTGLSLMGAYLAKVKVYELQRLLPSAPIGTSSRSATFIETMLLHKRRLLEILVDFSLICCAYVSAHLLRFEASLTSDLQRLIVRSLPLVIVVKLSCFVSFGLYRGVWKYVSLPDLLAIFKAVTLGSICSAVSLLYLWRFEGYSRAVFVIDWLLLFLSVSASRLVERLLNEWIMSVTEGSLPVLIIGAGDTGELVLRQVTRNDQWKRRVVGFLDDDRRKLGNRIHGRSVLGTREALCDVLRLYGIREVFIAMGKPPCDLVQHVKETCEGQGVNWKLLTAMSPES